MKTALHMREYEDILNQVMKNILHWQLFEKVNILGVYLLQEDIYSLLALASCANRSFGTCSRAFIKLESMDDLPEERKEDYQDLAMDIFVKQVIKR